MDTQQSLDQRSPTVYKVGLLSKESANKKAWKKCFLKLVPDGIEYYYTRGNMNSNNIMTEMDMIHYLANEPMNGKIMFTTTAAQQQQQSQQQSSSDIQFKLSDNDHSTSDNNSSTSKTGGSSHNSKSSSSNSNSLLSALASMSPTSTTNVTTNTASSKKNIFMLTNPDTVHCFRASSANEMNEWMQMIRQLLEQLKLQQALQQQQQQFAAAAAAAASVENNHMTSGGNDDSDGDDDDDDDGYEDEKNVIVKDDDESAGDGGDDDDDEGSGSVQFHRPISQQPLHIKSASLHRLLAASSSAAALVPLTTTATTPSSYKSSHLNHHQQSSSSSTTTATATAGGGVNQQSSSSTSGGSGSGGNLLLVSEDDEYDIAMSATEIFLKDPKHRTPEEQAYVLAMQQYTNALLNHTQRHNVKPEYSLASGTCIFLIPEQHRTQIEREYVNDMVNEYLTQLHTSGVITAQQQQQQQQQAQLPKSSPSMTAANQQIQLQELVAKRAHEILSKKAADRTPEEQEYVNQLRSVANDLNRLEREHSATVQHSLLTGSVLLTRYPQERTIQDVEYLSAMNNLQLVNQE